MYEGINDIQNCKFLYKCPLEWDTFDSTNNEDIRFCSVCNENVYKAHTAGEAQKYGDEGKCVFFLNNNEKIMTRTMGLVAPTIYFSIQDELEKATSLKEFKALLANLSTDVSSVYKKRVEAIEEAIALYEELLDEMQDLKCREVAYAIIDDLSEIRDILDGYAFSKVVSIRIKGLKEQIENLQSCEDPMTKRILTLEKNAPRCKKCENKMVIRESKNGYFWGCSDYPQCWGKRWLTKEEQEWLDSGENVITPPLEPVTTPENVPKDTLISTEVLELLASGINPITGEVLEKNHLINEPEIIRALYELLGMVKGNTQNKEEDLSLNDEEQSTFDSLKNWRWEVATEKGVPAYIVLDDKTLKRVSKIKPQSEIELLNIKGFGEKKVQDYGTDILEIVAFANSFI